MADKERETLFRVQSILNEIITPMLPLIIKKEFPEGIRPVEIQRWFQSHFRNAAVEHDELELVIRTYVVHEAIDIHKGKLKTIKLSDKKYELKIDDEKFNQTYFKEARALYLLTSQISDWLAENFPELKTEE